MADTPMTSAAPYRLVEVGRFVGRKTCDDLIRSFGMTERDFDITQDPRTGEYVVYHRQEHPMMGAGPIRGWFNTFDSGWSAATVAFLRTEGRSRRERRWMRKAFLHLQGLKADYDWPEVR